MVMILIKISHILTHLDLLVLAFCKVNLLVLLNFSFHIRDPKKAQAI